MCLDFGKIPRHFIKRGEGVGKVDREFVPLGEVTEVWERGVVRELVM